MKTYITTTLPYVNGLPHIGHALEFFQADAYSRYFKKKYGDESVFFNLGTDEHGLKIYLKAKEENISPKEYVNKWSEKWKKYLNESQIEYTFFYRTSSLDHHENAQKFWRECEKRGDIYKKKYEGLYCVGCEEFKTEKDLINGKCPYHLKKPINFFEENYFFKLSKYKDKITEYVLNNNFLLPTYKTQELLNFVSKMEDISISRLKKNLPWGIEVPNDSSQVMYVWFDALTNYVSTIGDFNDLEFNSWWDNSIQLCGPDNLRFQGGIWQAMLSSAGINFTKKLLVHGTVLDSQGEKMSKTVGNVISPIEQIKKYSLIPFRFYLLTSFPTFSDVSYKESDLVEHYNSKLADNFGNLYNRIKILKEKFEINVSEPENIFKAKVLKYQENFRTTFEDFDIKKSYEETFKLCDFGNTYVNSTRPWENPKDQNRILSNLDYLIEIVVEMLYPVIPDIIKMNQEKRVFFEKIQVS